MLFHSNTSFGGRQVEFMQDFISMRSKLVPETLSRSLLFGDLARVPAHSMRPVPVWCVTIRYYYSISVNGLPYHMIMILERLTEEWDISVPRTFARSKGGMSEHTWYGYMSSALQVLSVSEIQHKYRAKIQALKTRL